MSAFRVGQKVVCIKGDAWEQINGAPGDYSHPTFREICQINVVLVFKGILSLSLDGFRGYYTAENFRPLAYKPQSLEHDISLFNQQFTHSTIPAEGEDA